MNNRLMSLRSLKICAFDPARRMFNSAIDSSATSWSRRWRPTVSAAAFTISACGATAPEPEELRASIPAVGGREMLATGFEPKGDPAFIEFDNEGDGQSSGLERIRSDALREAARSFGSQHGFARRAWEIAQLLERRSPELSSAYDFNRVAVSTSGVPGFMLPPVVARTFDEYVLDRGSRSASHSDERFEVLKAAFLSPVVPTWQIGRAHV